MFVQILNTGIKRLRFSCDVQYYYSKKWVCVSQVVLPVSPLYPPFSLPPTPHSGVEGGIGVKGDWERAQTLIRLSMESLGGDRKLSVCENGVWMDERSV